MPAYKGPVICLTLEEGAAILPANPATPAAAAAAEKIKAAIASDPKWREPIR